ncbi:MAG: tRNA (N6-isopentenyl adenosine(37)-C2)-methylthiotransferase MiaB [Deltaproteobacteria bacterium]|jgi:tRNA-2-methylthio-N6-dimethylallyladenosine synthase|nr:tRNA (N6-isopentenyl adenosine(37)-C2)-methylthiotransferase MiaB [Deltaproteobacteria bacterium]
MRETVFHLQSFGCQMNAGDSAWLARSLRGMGLVQGGFEHASLHILNTCSVRDKAEQKVYTELGRIAHLGKVREHLTVCVGGCLARQAGEALFRRFSQIRLLFGPDGLAVAPEAISRLLEEPSLRLNLLAFSDQYEERADVRPEGAAAAFVNIMQGCDNFCAYCIVPRVRGRQKSRKPEAVLAECRSLLAAGTREITLLGQNVNSYGLDGGGSLPAAGAPFARLLREVAALPGLARLRFVTSHPKDISEEVIAAFGELKVLCPRLHLPLQSGSDRILQLMGRRYDAARYLEIVDGLKRARPDILLSTDIITGFPGETEEDFAATMDLLRRVNFAASFSFVYSDRPGTRAALMPGKVDRAPALDRLARLQRWQNQASEETLRSMIGRKLEVLIEEPSPRALALRKSASSPAPADCRGGLPSYAAQTAERSWQGKTPHGLIVHVPLPPRGEDGWRGVLVPVSVQAATKHSLQGIQAGAPW